METTPHDEDPSQVEQPEQGPLNPETVPSPVEALPDLLGFHDDPQLHADVVAALTAEYPDQDTVRQAWINYREATDAQLNDPDREHADTARLGRTVTEALIHEEAGDKVGYLAKLLQAEAENGGRWPSFEIILNSELNKYFNTGRLSQAQGIYATSKDETIKAIAYFEAAITAYKEVYEEVEATTLDDPFLDILHLRISECDAAIEDLRRQPQ